jgi:hypothetical protein
VTLPYVSYLPFLKFVLEVGDKVQELKKTHKWFLELASHSPEIHEQLRHDILDVKHEIQSFNISNKIL